MKAALAAVVFLSATCGSAACAQSGLLLGLGRPCLKGWCETVYRTLWIAPHGGKVQIVELPDLIVPRRMGFWRVGVRTYCDPNRLEDLEGKEEPWPRDAWFAGPVRERPVVDGLVPCPAHAGEDSCASDSISVTFVNGEYISLQEREATECGMHSDGSGTWTVRRLGDHVASPHAYSAIEGEGASDEYERRAAHALMENDQGMRNAGAPLGEGATEEDQEIRKSYPKWSSMTEVEKVAAMQAVDDGCFPKHNDGEWYIERNQGRWVAYGAFDTHRLCGVYLSFELPFPAALAGPATMPISLNAIRKQVPGAYDAFWLPNQEMVVVLVGLSKPLPGETFPSRTSLEVFSPHGQDLGKPSITMSLMDFEGPVMAESATGSNVARWTTELTKIKAQGVVKPLLAASPPQ
ncbi:MAG: hypothetical protein ABSF54_21975 [Bryobacteraceae bacterium]